MFTILVLLLVFCHIFRKDIKDQTNHQSNNNQLTIIHTLDNFTLVVIASAFTILAQSITHINTLTITHNNTKSTNGSSSRKAHNLVIHPLKDILKFHKNNPTIANNITNQDFHNNHENKNLTPLSSTFTIGKMTNKESANTTK